jgi:2-methylcitrate dehydratase
VEVKTKIPFHKPEQLSGFLDPYTKKYPAKMPGEVKIKMKSGEEYSLEKEDYYGFHTRPMSWADVKKKFKRLSQENADKELQQQIIDTITNLEKHKVKDLIKLITRAGKDKTKSIHHYKKAG